MKRRYNLIRSIVYVLLAIGLTLILGPIVAISLLLTCSKLVAIAILAGAFCLLLAVIIVRAVPHMNKKLNG